MRSCRPKALVATCLLLLGYPAAWTAAEAPATGGAEATTDPASNLGTLVVHVEDLASGEGNLRFVLFDSKKSFMKRPIQAGIVEINGRRGTWTVEGLAYGTYAVLVHHDIDNSGKMERHWYGKPKEPTGASNDAPSKFGPPKFKDAKFELDSALLEMTVTVK